MIPSMIGTDAEWLGQDWLKAISDQIQACFADPHQPARDRQVLKGCWQELSPMGREARPRYLPYTHWKHERWILVDDYDPNESCWDHWERESDETSDRAELRAEDEGGLGDEV